MPDQRTHAERAGTHPDPHSEHCWPDRFAGQVIMVTGAAGGLGSDTARRLAREGARVVCTDAAPSGAEDGSSPEDCLPLDVTQRPEWDRTLESVLSEHTRIDGALFAHGIRGPRRR